MKRNGKILLSLLSLAGILYVLCFLDGKNLQDVHPNISENNTPITIAPVITVPVNIPEECNNASQPVFIPEYTGNAYTVINNNIPFFSKSELACEPYTYYSELDTLGRCGYAMACLSIDMIPTEERGSIGSIKPTGWHNNKYPELIEDLYVYNRCHLLAFCVTGHNVVYDTDGNAKNLITGTRYMNVEGMLPFETKIAKYIEMTENHVLYKVTPVFDGDNLLVSGVYLQAYSIEDNGAGICFNVFCHNVQPGIILDYKTGQNQVDESYVNEESEYQTEPTESSKYAVNSKNGKIHILGACSATGTGDDAMSKAAYFDTYEEAEAYSKQIVPDHDKRNCGNCW